LTINGATALPNATSDLVMAGAVNDRSVLKLNASLTIGRSFYMGNNNPSAAACFQTSGTTTVTNYLGVGSATNSYGYYRLSGGTLNVRTYFELATTGYGVVDILDGILSTENGFSFARQTGGVGVLNVFGGIAKAPSGGNPIQMGWGDRAGPVGRITIMGSGVVDAANGSGTTKMLDMNSGNAAGGNTAVNLLKGGTLIANKVSATRAGTTTFNFDGGILRASLLTGVGGTFLTGLDSAIVYAGGAIIDSTNANITIAQPLLAPTGYGVVSVKLTSGGAGYMGPPAVIINGGSSSNATAIARVDLDPNSETYGQVIAIDITSSGIRYQPSDTLTVSLLGGGYTSPASASATLGVNGSGGGLTKLGLGGLTLSGVNTYVGSTTISNGTLSVGIVNALPTNSVVNVYGGSYGLGGFTVTNGVVNTISGSIVNGGLNSGVINKDGPGLVTFSAVQTAPSPVNINGGTFALGSVPAGLFEGRILNNSFDLTTPNPQTEIQLSTRYANMYFANAAASAGIWPDNTTYIYTGYLWNNATTNETWSFMRVFDDMTRIMLNGINILDNRASGALVSSNAVVRPGANRFELRLGQGGGAVGNNGAGWYNMGIGYDRLGRNQLVYANYATLTDPGDGSLLTPYAINNQSYRSGMLADASTVKLAADAVLDLGTMAQTLAGVSGSGTISNSTLTVTGYMSPAETNVIGTLTAKANITLSGKLLVDVATNTTSDCDCLVVEPGADRRTLTLTSSTLEIQNPQALSTLKVYTVVTFPVGSLITDMFTLPEYLNSTMWALRKTPTKIQLYCQGGTLLLFK
jgi:autotransporter-associated beta strand protein